MTLILALDVATVSGWARGRIGETPTSGSVRFGNVKKPAPAVFADAINWMIAQLEQSPLPDLLIIEDMLPPLAMHNETTRSVRDRLAGLHGVCKGIAHRYNVPEIATASVGDVRAHFIGERSLKRAPAKQAVMERCRALGWYCADDNAGDALAVWSYACALIDPTWALHVSPMFNKRLRVTA